MSAGVRARELAIYRPSESPVTFPPAVQTVTRLCVYGVAPLNDVLEIPIFTGKLATTELFNKTFSDADT